MTSSEIDIRQAAKFFKQKTRRHEARLDERFQQAWRDCQAIIDLIIRKYRPERLYQWGSLLDRRKFSDVSDIDLAVEGLESAEQFFALYAEAEQLTDFPLDLVEWEHLDPLHQASIRRKGRLIYARAH